MILEPLRALKGLLFGYLKGWGVFVSRGAGSVSLGFGVFERNSLEHEVPSNGPCWGSIGVPFFGVRPLGYHPAHNKMIQRSQTLSQLSPGRSGIEWKHTLSC